ncbi:hypothetical protein FDC50_07040 [Clostridium botulinum]|uniref:DUF7210 domain-containing protein n=1 Tax=Clostridium botulinum (strain Eklund 17B / Type B) TaxID=935198 RepID=B2TNW5_CLOBB|nr:MULTISPECIES: hypothetical protein [unclassified Clostridium]ACD23463.1 hypothetical protein CLL_A2734 [Clostridium botulinum B str. Eklund 17B (NRP)]AIY80722.1 hypothetical protein U728_827 [Clostridium botulinum 202F]KAI3344260.1 hypothetical protein CIT17_17745 [Clostridium botulinum]KFX56091.1 hypothetical protein KU41_17060 [Clostridium botulinum]KFX56677.1 hypothetical protein KU40_08180 [Clostridium botulinum]
MAKSKQCVCKATALVCIKYDKTSYKPGEEFLIREDDVNELKEKGYASVEILENDDKKGEGQEGE